MRKKLNKVPKIEANPILPWACRYGRVRSDEGMPMEYVGLQTWQWTIQEILVLEHLFHINITIYMKLYRMKHGIVAEVFATFTWI